MGSLILVGRVAEQLRTLDIRCCRCSRAGRVSMARILREFGPDTPIYKAWEDLNHDCPKRCSHSIYERCQLGAPQLIELRP